MPGGGRSAVSCDYSRSIILKTVLMLKLLESAEPGSGLRPIAEVAGVLPAVPFVLKLE